MSDQDWDGSGYDADVIGKFFMAIQHGDVSMLERRYEDAGALINLRDQRHNATPLHFAAAFRMRRLIKWLIRFPELDYLVKDGKGRLPSTIAYEEANDPVIARFLVKKEIEQAKQQGIDIRSLERIS